LLNLQVIIQGSISRIKILPVFQISVTILNVWVEKPIVHEMMMQRFQSACAGQAPTDDYREVNMGKYVAYFLIFLVIIIALEYFQIVDVPYFDLPDLSTKGQMIHDQSEENMKRRFGD
jgi:hypothetical protein